MAGTFDFCPNSQVPETLPPEPVKGISFNGWSFASRPVVPYQKRFTVTLHGLRWYLQPSGLYDTVTDAQHNARLLEQFYETNGVWDSFSWNHPHYGAMTVKFSEPVTVPKSLVNSYGLVEALQIQLIEHQPGFS